MAKAKRKQEKRSLSETLDPAVMERFPGVHCETYFDIFSMHMVTRWWQEGTENTPLKPALARQVGAFVPGYMAALNQESQ